MSSLLVLVFCFFKFCFFLKVLVSFPFSLVLFKKKFLFFLFSLVLCLHSLYLINNNFVES